MELVVTTEALDLLIEKGTSLDYGARPLRRAIEGYLEDPLAEELLRGSFHGKDRVIAKVHEVEGEQKIRFDTEILPKPETTEPETTEPETTTAPA